jgi:DNA (cytosine-5)-methyltransferase 1
MEKINPTFGSVCDGIGCGHLAFEREGYDCQWSSEIEPFPSAVLAYRFPDVRNIGNMMLACDMIESKHLAAPDVFIGGTPCQAFSIAGKREGLNDERGNLSLEFCRIADGIDAVRHADGKDGCTILWENVPGVLSDKGNAFGCFLGMLAGEDEAVEVEKWPRAGVVCGTRRRVAWCVLDSQYFGVAQRRRRVFVVAVPNQLVERLGERADPAEILSIGYSLRRDTPSRKDTGKAVAGYAPTSFGKYTESLGTLRASGGDYGGGSEVLVGPSAVDDVANCLQTTCNDYSRADGFNMVVEPNPQALCENHAQDCRVTGPHDVSPMLSAKMGTGGGNVPLVGSGEQEGDAYKCGTCSHFGRQTAHQTICPACGADDYENVMLMPTIGPYAGKVFASCYGRYVDQDRLDSEGQLIEGEKFWCPDCKESFFDKYATGAAGSMTPAECPKCGSEKCEVYTGQETKTDVHAIAVADVIHSDKACNGNGRKADGSAYTLDTMATQGVCTAFSCKDNGRDATDELSPTLRSMAGVKPNGGGQVAVCFGGDVTRTLSARHDSSPCVDRGQDIVATTSTVRRLLPSECETLQGLPRNWTLIPWSGKPASECPDGPRYKGIGNGQTVQVMQWLAMRIRNAITEG